MERITRSVGTAAILALALVLLLQATDLINLRWPFSVDVTTEKRSIGVSPDAPAEITRIEPISLDCRARIHATVPVTGKKEHRLAGQVYRTDRITMYAIGDIDTCVDSSAVEVINRDDGTTRVLVPADAIQFVRPRVDANAMLGSVNYDKGWIGKFADAFPWVSDSEGLTAAGYAFAQNMVGSSACMEAAFDTTSQTLVNAYRQQALARGQDPSSVTVDIVGTPNFDQAQPSRLEEFDFEVGDDTTCVLSSSSEPL